MGYGSLKPDGYKKRVFDSLLGSALEVFPAVEVAGPMWCGKTWTSLAHGESVTQIGREAVRRVVSPIPHWPPLR